MNFRRLGRTGLNVSEIGLGSEAFVNRAEGESLALIQAAIGAGINYFDLYNPEPYVRDVLGKAMEGRREKFILQAHLCSAWLDGQYKRTRNMDEVKAAFADLLTRLRTDHIEVGMIHYVDQQSDFSRLDIDYIDLLLLHQQVGDYMGAWKDMEKAVAQGKVRAIGLSNFESERLEEVCEAAAIKPAVLQVECHPYFQQEELKKRLAPYGTVIESWYPIGHGDPGLINEPVFTELAQKYGKTNVQVILRWHIQAGNIIFPKSTNPQHIRDNSDIFDFALTDDEMARIKAIDNGKGFYTATLEEQERNFSGWAPAD
ncbi:aldo/keto reductase [Acutalibacter sp. JLR.KK004]|uniref:aldo/keto reductase n=1 Tax=Acutalibacter sp. JLR.KK004 TaxID=3112622 RepID=UPI002FF1C214